MFGYKVKDFSKGFYKWIICIYKGVYNLLRAQCSCCYALFYQNAFFTGELRYRRFFKIFGK